MGGRCCGPKTVGGVLVAGVLASPLRAERDTARLASLFIQTRPEPLSAVGCDNPQG